MKLAAAQAMIGRGRGRQAGLPSRLHREHSDISSAQQITDTCTTLRTTVQTPKLSCFNRCFRVSLVNSVFVLGAPYSAA